MLMDIKCSAVTSIAVHLEFDDGHKKDRVIALGDLIEVEYNANGLRKKAEGKVINISTIGADPKQWYIILDGSDDFDSNKVRFSPMSILNVDIIRKAGYSPMIYCNMLWEAFTLDLEKLKNIPIYQTKLISFLNAL